MLRSYLNHQPKVHISCWVDPSALIIGQCEIGRDSSIWPMCVLRGDVNAIHIGEKTNIQDGTIIHTASPSKEQPQGWMTIVGNDVTIGHRVTLHACQVKDYCLIGMGSTILDGAIIAPEVIIGAHSLVTQGQHLASGFLYLGTPAKQIRPITKEERQHIQDSAKHYCLLANNHRLSGESS